MLGTCRRRSTPWIGKAEEHLVQKIADLFNLRHRGFLQAKRQVQAELG
jgi:hypothetical protein